MKSLFPQRKKLTRFAKLFAIAIASTFGGFFLFCFGDVVIGAVVGAVVAKFGPAWGFAGILLTISFCAAMFAFFVSDRL